MYFRLGCKDFFEYFLCAYKKCCPVPARDKNQLNKDVSAFSPRTNLSAARRGKAFLGRTQGSKVLLPHEGGLSHKPSHKKQ